MNAFSKPNPLVAKPEDVALAATAAEMVMDGEKVGILPEAARPISARAQENGSVALTFASPEGAQAFQEGLLALCGSKNCAKRDIVCGPTGMFNIGTDGVTLTVHNPKTVTDAIERLDEHPMPPLGNLFVLAVKNYSQEQEHRR